MTKFNEGKTKKEEWKLREEGTNSWMKKKTKEGRNGKEESWGNKFKKGRERTG